MDEGWRVHVEALEQRIAALEKANRFRSIERVAIWQATYQSFLDRGETVSEACDQADAAVAEIDKRTRMDNPDIESGRFHV